jgi:hypothetical protein
MNKIRALIAFCCITASVSVAHGQGAPYDQAIGIKIPAGFSVTYKQFISDTHSIEAQASFWQKGFRLSGLYEFNFYTFDGVPNLGWFVGGGAHIGTWNSKYKEEYDSNVDFGIDGIIGLDYKFPDLPLNLSVDWQPSLALIGSNFSPAYGGIGIRYTF